jgi:hypothetical protein
MKSLKYLFDMEKILKTVLTFFVLSLVFACEEEQDKVTLLGGTSPALSVSSSTDLVLTKDKEYYSSLQFRWTNPDYKFSNGVNTQDVNYTLQVDTAGSNFSNPKIVGLTFTKDVSHSFTVKELNTALSGLELKDFVPHNFEFRVKATLANNSEPVYSNVLPIKITTYLDVVYPVPDKLYITGDATPKGWMGGGDAENLSQKFTKTNAYTFVLSNIQMKASNPFLFVPVYGNWDNKYGFTGAKAANNPSGDSFKPGGEDLVSPATTKTYKITVNFKTGKYSFE